MSPVIDAHAHLWQADDGLRPWLAGPGLESINRTFTSDELCARASLAGVDAVVLVEGGASHPADTEMLLAAARTSSRVAGVVIWIDLLSPTLETELGDLLAGPDGRLVLGIRTQVQGEDNDYLDLQEVRAGIAAVGRAGLPFELVLRRMQRPSALALVAALPEVRFVIDHLGNPDFDDNGRPTAGWFQWMSALAAHDNVAVKLSALHSAGIGVSESGVRELVESAIGLFSPARLAWGSDWPTSLLHDSYVQTAALAHGLVAGLSAEEQSSIFGGTAERVFGLEAR
jgi:L-fuconolactonase